LSLQPGPVPPVPEHIRDELGTIVRDADFADLDPNRGQPALSPRRLALVPVLQGRADLSDRPAAEAVRARIDGKYLLGLGLTDPGGDASVLSEFRARLLAGDDADGVDGADGRDPVMGERDGHRVVIGVEADQRQRVDAPQFDPGGQERLPRRGDQRGPLLVEQLGLGRGLAPESAPEVGTTPRLQVGVERLQAAMHGRDRHEEAAAGRSR
jgi:hypothetical protein